MQNAGQAESKRARERALQTESNTGHSQLTNAKQGLLGLNGQRCELNPAGFRLLSLGDTLLQLLTWTALKECAQECKLFHFSQQQG